MNSQLNQSSLSQQLAVIAALLCLTVALSLVTLGGISSRHMQLAQQEAYGTALAHQIARRIGTALETGDLLSVAASLQRFVETSSAEQVAILDVEGNALGQAGEIQGREVHHYRAPVHIENDIAGEVVITVTSDAEDAAHLRFLLSLLGLALLLSLAVFMGTRHFAQRLSKQINTLSKVVALDDGETPVDGNELQRLHAHIEKLPMDLLRTRSSGSPQDEHYQTTAVLYLHLTSLSEYVDTLDHQSLHRYTRRLHQVVYAAAGFYGGELQVSRQFGVSVYFSGANSSGSAAFRAASCAWLIQAVCTELEKHMPLSLSLAMAVASSELGTGDGGDIYPGLYMQHTLDELQALCAARPPRVLLSPAVLEDIDVAGRVEHQATEMKDYAMLIDFAGPYHDLLERQLRLICKRLLDPTNMPGV